jgi:hypothetical protein
MSRENLFLALAFVASPFPYLTTLHTFVPLHPNLHAASFATSSPNPSINPFTKGSSRFIAAPRRRPQIVGGLYRIKGVSEDEAAGESEDEGESEMGAE